jgi:hypothetical protein
MFKQADFCWLLRRRAACILPRNLDGADLLIPRDGEEIKYGAILVQVKNCVQASDTKDLGRKLFASYVFKQWTEVERKIPFFRVVLELGLSRVNKKPSNIPVFGRVDLITVSVEEDQNTSTEAAFIINSSNSKQGNRFAVFKKKSHTVEKGEVKFLRLRGIAGVPWMDEATYDGFTELLEGPFEAR